MEIRAEATRASLYGTIRSIAAAAFVGAFFLWFAGGGIRAGLNADDTTNLYVAWDQPAWHLAKASLMFFSGEYRPLGGAFYRLIFHWAGLNPLPYRMACFVLLLANLYLLYRFASLLTESRAIGWLTTLIACYHARATVNYYSTGMVYDLLCFFFYFLAFGYYLRIRQRGRLPGGLQLLLFSILYICALDSKEMAVSLPVFVAIYEALYHGPRTLHWRDVAAWLGREGRAACATGIVTLIFIAGKLSPGSAFQGVSGYQLAISPGQYLENSRAYWNLLFYLPGRIPAGAWIALWSAMAAFAWIRRSRHLAFSLSFILLAILPLAFIPARPHTGEIYVPMVGWALYIASAASMPGPRMRAVLYCAIVAVLFAAHSRAKPAPEEAGGGGEPQIRAMLAGLARLPRAPAPHSQIAVLDNVFGPHDWTAEFVTRLRFRDPTLYVRMWDPGQKPAPADLAGFDYCFQFKGGLFLRLDCAHAADAPRIGAFVEMSDPNADAYIVQDVSDTIGPWRWTYSHPRLRFLLASNTDLAFRMDVAASATTLRQTGPFTIAVSVNDHPLGALHCDKAGEQHFERAVDPRWIEPGAIARVALEPDKVYVSPQDGARLGFLLVRAGFREHGQPR